MTDIYKQLYGTSEKDLIAAKKAQQQVSSPFTPEHSGISDDGRPLAFHEVIRGGAVTRHKDDLEAQRVEDWGPDPLMAIDRPLVQLRQKAAKEMADDAQADAEAQAKVIAKAEAKQAKEDAKVQPVKIVDDETSGV